jgi:hypothetical protein
VRIAPNGSFRARFRIFPAAAGKVDLAYAVERIGCDQRFKFQVEIVQLAVEIVQVEDDEAVHRFDELFQELAMAAHFVRRIGKREVLQSDRAAACVLDALQPIDADGERFGGIRHADRRTFVEVFAGHETEMLGDVVEGEMRGNFFEVVEPLLLFGQPFPGKEGEEYPVPDEPAGIAVGVKQLGEPVGNVPDFGQRIERPFDRFDALSGKQRQRSLQDVGVKITGS